jgi:hypothetical protein
LGNDLLVECLSDRAGGGFPDGSTLHPLDEPLLHDDDVAVTSAGARERAHQVGADCLPWLPVWCRVHLPRRLARRAVPDVLGGLSKHAGPVVPERQTGGCLRDPQMTSGGVVVTFSQDGGSSRFGDT